MKDKTIFLWYLLLLYNKISYTESVFYTISRTTSLGNAAIDNFTIPGSNCGENSGIDCSSFNAIDHAGRSCYCDCRPTKSTFAFTTSENQWICIENSEVRTKLQSDQYRQPGEKACSPEMETLFINEYQHSSLRVFNYGDGRGVQIESSWNSCEVDTSHSWFFECNASRLSSRKFLNTLRNLFTLVKGQSYYILKVSRNVSDAHMLKGRIINLGILCRNTTETRHCLLFKFQGTFTCDTSGSVLRASSTAAVATASIAHETTIPSRTVLPSTTTKIQPSSTIRLSTPFYTVGMPTTTPKSRVSESRPSPREREQRGDDVSSSFLGIVISVAASLLLAAIIMLFVVTRCRFSRKSPTDNDSEEAKTSVASTLSNLAFQPDEPDVYEQNGYLPLNFREPVIYSSNYQVPPGNRRTPSFNEMTNPIKVDRTADHVYEHIDPTYIDPAQSKDNSSELQEPRPISHEQRVYNLIEEFSTANLRETTKEKLKIRRISYLSDDACDGGNGVNDKAANDACNDGSNTGTSDIGTDNALGCANRSPSKTEPVCHVIEEASTETTGDPRNELPRDGPVYCTLDELDSNVFTTPIDV